MSDRTPEQINHTLDQVMAISAENTRNHADLQNTVIKIADAVSQLINSTDRRATQHDLELDDHDERVERLERDHLEHADRMAKMEQLLVEIKEERNDIREILQMMTRRFSGE
jgi:chromosome segregation ATPase